MSGRYSRQSITGDDAIQVAKRTALASVVGGTVAKAGGGKFANGAVSAAFVHLFNSESDFFTAEKLVNKVFTEAGYRELYFQPSSDRYEFGPFGRGFYDWDTDTVVVNTIDVGYENYGQDMYETELTTDQARELLETHFEEALHAHSGFINKFSIMYLESDTPSSKGVWPGNWAHQSIHNAARQLTDQYYDEYERLRKAK
jgi:hypothetical protein